MAVCIACFSTGSCNGTCASSKPVEHRNMDALVHKLIDRGIEPYTLLDCGHATTREAQAAYAAFRPKGKHAFCETCGHWVKRKPKPKPAPLPNQPEF